MSGIWYKAAMPIVPDYIDNLHDERLRKSIDPNTEIVVYHGTSSVKFAEIMAHGGLDPSVSGSDQFKTYEGASPGIFVTTSQSFFGAELYAYVAVVGDDPKSKPGSGGDQMILSIVIPIGWIEKDPDDTRYDPETGEMNDLGKNQGVVRQKIPLRRVREVTCRNPVIAGVIGSYGDLDFDQDRSAWMPVGKFMDVVSKLVRKGEDLGPEYSRMVSVRPRGMARSAPQQERLQDVADGLSGLIATMRDPNVADYTAILTWVYGQGMSAFSPGSSSKVWEIFDLCEPGSSAEVKEDLPDHMLPRPGESLAWYVERVMR